ncbi:10799_t:CDS:2, partial [Acaulospora colombiana]
AEIVHSSVLNGSHLVPTKSKPSMRMAEHGACQRQEDDPCLEVQSNRVSGAISGTDPGKRNWINTDGGDILCKCLPQTLLSRCCDPPWTSIISQKTSMAYIQDASYISYIVIAASVVAGTAIIHGIANNPAVKARRAGAQLPPGPKRDFLIGNLRNFPKDRWYETFTRWKDEFGECDCSSAQFGVYFMKHRTGYLSALYPSDLLYTIGDLIYVNLAGVPMLVCNSLEAAEELTLKRMSIYSSRPYRTMTNQRKVLRKAMGSQAAQEYDCLIQAECARLVEDFSGFSGEPFSVVSKYIGAIIVKFGYGEKIYQEHGEEMVELNKERSRQINLVLPKVWLYIPSWFPGANFRRVGIEGTKTGTKVNGVADDSIIAKYINDPSVPNEHLRDAVAMMYAGNATSIVNFFFAMILHPEVQKKVHEELDRKIGGGRAPDMNDIKELEYFNAAWNESMRCNATVPLAAAYGLSTDQGTTLSRYILRDPKIWGADADKYNPNRFLPQFNPRVKDLPDMSSVPFGFGRR